MILEERIEAFQALGHKINNLTPEERELIYDKARNLNPWFIPSSIELSLNGISQFLNKEKLQKWVEPHGQLPQKDKRIGIVMAGNIPLVGYHDYLSILISGNQSVIKLSTQDNFLLPTLHKWLVEIEPRFTAKVNYEERLNMVDGIIATGSDNTARYFEYYFRNIPHIIRKNRSSIAIIMGEEDQTHLNELGKDVFSYFGLGCRNISKIFVPEGYEFIKLFEAWNSFKDIIHHHKYSNNYDYQKSILLVNKVPHFDNGFVLITENESLVSPISVVYFETYLTQKDLKSKLKAHRDKLQCLVSANGWFEGSIPFGKAQLPELWDYADGQDTLAFCREIN